ncbi:SDR family oxidoreductase [Brevibacillus sp. B_LB10_24]|uniref:SDR family oxidoreductase n=1 Tax=Brevibacillus sp. B_LB10_24 TaxID=3380645 RepID=UPI0038B81CD1
MDLGLTGKRALVTAASQGLGRAIATELAREGCKVVISSRREDTLQEVAEEICQITGAAPGSVTGIAADVTKAEDIRQLVQRANDILGGIDILVTNAGGPPAGTFDKLTDEMWQDAFQLNMMSVVRLIRETLPIMRSQGGGRILNVSSSSVKQPIANLMLSNAIRTGTMAMLKTLAAEVAPENIQVHNLAPGRIFTERVKTLDQISAERQGIDVESVKTQEQARIPMGRYGQPEEFGRVAAFLLSSANSYMTGQTVFVDGGSVRSL